MAKIDKLLSHMISRGAPILRLASGEPAVLELPGGHRSVLNQQELLGTVLDGLIKEILPPDLETTYLRGDQISFDYVFEEIPFHFVSVRSRLGPSIIVGRHLAAAAVAKGTQPYVPLENNGQTQKSRLEQLVGYLLARGGSDLYLNAGEAPVLRLAGHLESMERYGKLSGKDVEEMLKPWIPPTNLEAYQGGLETEFSHSDPDQLHRMRISLFHDGQGPSVALRIIPKQVPDPDVLGMSEAVRRLAALNKGLVLISGSPGSGKSTTLACLLELANRSRNDYIAHIQDSTEFELRGGKCVFLAREAGRNAQRQSLAIRAALRQAPDILAIDELRDPGNVEWAVQAAHSGRLVLATVPTTSLLDTLYFMRDAFPEEQRDWAVSRLAECLKAIVGLTLLKRTNGGRTAAMETLFNNPTLANLLREDKLMQIPAAMKGGRYGQVSHNEALIELLQIGEVEPMEAYLRCQDRDSFISACKKAGIPFDPRSAGRVTEV